MVNKLLDFGYILKVKFIGFIDILEMEDKRRKGFEDDVKFLI